MTQEGNLKAVLDLRHSASITHQHPMLSLSRTHTAMVQLITEAYVLHVIQSMVRDCPQDMRQAREKRMNGRDPRRGTSGMT